MGTVVRMQPASGLNCKAPDFRALTDRGVRDLASFRGQWLALMYCPRESCDLRAQCAEGLSKQMQEIGAMGGQLLILHPLLGRHDKDFELALRARKLKPLLVGTIRDPKFLQAYQVRDDDGLGHGVTGIFLIDPQGKLRAAARYTACAPVIVHEIASSMRAAIERFGQSGTQTPPTADLTHVVPDANYGCVEWFQY